MIKTGYSNDAFEQQKLFFINNRRPIIFDVGAYIGKISMKYLALFPEANIYSFEPYKKSFNILKEDLKSYTNIETYNFAFSDKNGKIKLNVNKFLPTNSILESSPLGQNYWGKELLDTEKKITIKTFTIDSFCVKKCINQIDILKLDTQGSEYLILKGAGKMLWNKSISLIYMEIILVETYKGQKLFSEITDLLDNFGYRLFNIYNPNISNKGDLNQVDAIFLPHGVSFER